MMKKTNKVINKAPQAKESSSKRVDNYMMKKTNKVINKVLQDLKLKGLKKGYSELKVHQTEYFLDVLCLLENSGKIMQAFEQFQSRA